MTGNRATAMIPSTFTFMNLFCGFFSIIKSIEGNYHIAAWLIIVSALIDAVDGKVARWTGAESRFGLHLDSLCDVVAFGLAPAMLIHQAAFQSFPPMIGIPLSFLFLFGGVYRLARYNTINAELEEHAYMGLTIPIAAMTVGTFWLFQNAWLDEPVTGAWIVLAIAVPFLMMSTIPYLWPRVGFKNGWKRSIQSAAIIGGLAIALIFADRVLFPMFCVFILVGLINWIISIVRGEESLWNLFFVDTQRDA
jgi:CDP-diacylglycerol---serine O-phosphatidyltransferase